MLDYIRLDILVRDKQSSLFDSFGSYEETEPLLNWHQGPYSQHFIFFVIYESAH